METITITFKNFENRMKSLETKNLNKYGESLSFSSYSHYFNPCILEIQDNKLLIIDKQKYKEILHKALTNNLQNEDYNDKSSAKRII